MKKKKCLGFTLMELLVVVIIMGILAAFAIPGYMKSIETSKAEDAASIASMVGTTNRMYALDHNGTYVDGEITTACNSAACTNGGSACDLVACSYLARQDWSAKQYIIRAGRPNGGTFCNAVFADAVACAIRKNGGPAISSNWRYDVRVTGIISGSGSGVPAPVSP